MSAQHTLKDRAAELLELVGPLALTTQARAIAGGTSPSIIAERLGRPDAAPVVSALAAAAREWGPEKAEAYLEGLSAGYALRPQDIEAVWTGPTTHGVPVRSTQLALLNLVEGCRRELWLSTYSAKSHAPLLESIERALRRGVSVSIAIETLSGAGSAIAGSEPAAAFAVLKGARLYTWPVASRPIDAKLHAKLALADAETLLVTSANFTVSGMERNLEAGLLVKGGQAPKRTAEHLAALVRSGHLERI
jgi:phosphatidylserine/phosphatidylglycerophosphate/cardiolipin synthase-like enzyme